MNISWKKKITNEKVLEMVEEERTLLQTVKIRKVEYCGHVLRHNDLIKAIMERKVNGKRGRGRPQRMWMNDIVD